MSSTFRTWLALALCLLPSIGEAGELEWAADLSLGGGTVFEEQGQRGVFRFGAHTDLVFLRESNRDVGLGLYGEVMTSTFRDVTGGTGLLLLLPVHRALPLQIFFGPHYTYSGEHAAGIGGRLWFGLRNHNHMHAYNGSLGIWVEARGDLTEGRAVIVAAGLDLDIALFVYPVMWIERWARGPDRL